jgi:hypothetical protein
MKTHKLSSIVVIIFAFFSVCCTPKYSSVEQFHTQNGVPLQTFTINSGTGGNFTTPQGTKVTVPANAFISNEGNLVTGNVKIEFKDIYKKSDMLLTDISTAYIDGKPIKSGGMFFIKAINNNNPVNIAPNKKIIIEQPLQEVAPDSNMKPMILVKKERSGWSTNTTDQLQISATSYIFSLYQFSSPNSSGTWGNSDNPNFFGGSITTLTLLPLDAPAEYTPDMFLVFKNINCMVHVYNNGTNFTYNYAPLGFECTAVAIGVKNGILYSSFKPITITENLTVEFSLMPTTTDIFKMRLNELNQ